MLYRLYRRMSSKEYICKDISNLRLYKGYYLDKAHEYRDFHNYRRELISEKQVFKLFDNHQSKIISDLNEHEIADNLKNQEAVWYNPYYLKNINYLFIGTKDDIIKTFLIRIF